ncbi:putative ABC transport system ATP-binding protein [Prauserella shujinwangii]|uniref:Putative ABC transport system ATP-binding protein n=1 Tax=Prauserella shujinwangii TaxID=1453103 RepID=A0A2T0LKK3_9PSEU|nr:ATP-binding cassette domain-containing protein [Prauserella shujinwangii]PRX43440.1 putative ABC transport system ATP-binding protein [Prauserella shujinwangii]
MTRTDAPALRCAGVGHGYPVDGRVVRVLSGVGLTAERAAVTALTGPSGSGKSTLLRILACLERPDEGTVEVAGTEAARLPARRRRALRRAHVGYVFQDPADNLLDYLTAAEHLALGARLRGAGTDAAGARAVLDALGLGHRAAHRPRQLSGGEQQRLALAFAAAGDSALLVADEPTAQLDRSATGLVLDALRHLAGRGHAVVVATHDPQVRGVADQVIELRDGSRTEV